MHAGRGTRPDLTRRDRHAPAPLTAVAPPTVVTAAGALPGTRPAAHRVHITRQLPAPQQVDTRPIAAKPAPRALAPLKRLGTLISRASGLSLFGGRRGWVYGGTLLVAVAMICVALTGGGPIGRSRRKSS